MPAVQSRRDKIQSGMGDMIKKKEKGGEVRTHHI